MPNMQMHLEQYKKYVKVNPTDIRGRKRCKILSISQWIGRSKSYSDIKVAIMPIVNSRFADFSPAFGTKSILKSILHSSRKGSTGN